MFLGAHLATLAQTTSHTLTSSEMLCAPVAKNCDECFLVCAKLALTSSIQVLQWQLYTCAHTHTLTYNNSVLT